MHTFLGWYGQGPFGSDQYFQLAIAPVDARFPQLVGDDANASHAEFTATANTHFYLVSNAVDFLVDGSGLICTVTFAAGSHTATFSYNGETVVPAGTILYLVCDHVPDPTLAEVQILFAGDPL
jgi:hypothetical protein